MSLKNWSTTAASNNSASPNGAPEGWALSDINNTMRQVMADVRTLAASNTIASAATCDLGSLDETFLTVSGTTTITALGTVSAGIYKFVTFSGALTLTHNGTSLILPGAANITTVAGDTALFLSLGSGNWKCVFYQESSHSTYQPLDATLTALAGWANGAAKIPYTTATDTVASLDLSTNTSLGTSDTTLSSQKAVKTYVDASAIGVGQTWSHPVRAIATPYTNGARPIQITVSVTCAGGGSEGAVLTVGGVTVGSAINNGLGTNIVVPISAIVPAGAVYRVDATSGAPSIYSWAELS